MTDKKYKWDGRSRPSDNVYRERWEEIFGKKIEGAHRSLNDVEATIEIIKWYKKEGHI